MSYYNEKILVIGDFILDEYIYGNVNRVSPEDRSVPVLDESQVIRALGGCGNVAKNLSALGCKNVHTSSVIHYEAEELFDEYDIDYVDSTLLGICPVKVRFVDLKTGKQLLRHDNILRYEDYEIEHFHEKFMHEIQSELKHYGCIVISDYNKGIINSDFVYKAFDSFEGPIFVDTKQPSLSCWQKDNRIIMKINAKEFKQMMAMPVDVRSLIVTYGQEGCVFFDSGITDGFGVGSFYDTTPIFNSDVIGAGDCFLAGLVKKYMETGSVDAAIHYANRVASKSVEKTGTSTVFMGEIDE